MSLSVKQTPIPSRRHLGEILSAPGFSTPGTFINVSRWFHRIVSIEKESSHLFRSGPDVNDDALHNNKGDECGCSYSEAQCPWTRRWPEGSPEP